MLNVVFCDDDMSFLDRIKKEAKTIFKKLGIQAEVYIFYKGNALVESLKSYNMYYDIIFWGIDISTMAGKDIVKELKTLDKKFGIVFLTAYEQELSNAFQEDISEPIPKLLILKRFSRVLGRVVAAINKSNTQIQTFHVKNEKKENRVVKISLNEIMYFEKVNKRVLMHLEKETFLLHGYQISKIMEAYREHGFVCVHRACTVNVKYILSVGESEIHLYNGELLPISRRKKRNVYDQFVLSASEVN